jgi:methylglyoxal reductase
MQLRELGQSKIQASVIGLGTWAIGGWAWGGTDEARAIEGIHAALDAGINLIDTAPAYGLGRSEEIIGRAIKDRRDKVVLATKCGLVWHTQQGRHFFDEEGKPVHRYLGPESIRHEVEQSLRRLGTDYLDLLQTHWQDPTTPIEETMGALLELKREGKIRAIGISNASREDLERYLKVGPVDVAQEKYSMLDRRIEAGLLPLARERGVAILAYSPLELGLLSGKIGPDRVFPEDDQRHGHPLFTPENLARVDAMLKEIAPIAERLGLTLAQLVVAWTVAQPGITHALVGARNAQQARENAASGTAAIGPEDLQAIDAAIARHGALVRREP